MPKASSSLLAADNAPSIFTKPRNCSPTGAICRQHRKQHYSQQVGPMLVASWQWREKGWARTPRSRRTANERNQAGVRARRHSTKYGRRCEQGTTLVSFVDGRAGTVEADRAANLTVSRTWVKYASERPLSRIMDNGIGACSTGGASTITGSALASESLLLAPLALAALLDFFLGLEALACFGLAGLPLGACASTSAASVAK
jgi:hypothetical protein